MKALDTLPGYLEMAFEDLDPESDFSGTAAFSFPVVNGLDGSIDLGAGSNSFIHESIGDGPGFGFGFDGRPANSQLRRWGRWTVFLFRFGNSGNNRLTRNRFKVKGRIPFTKRRHLL